MWKVYALIECLAIIGYLIFLFVDARFAAGPLFILAIGLPTEYWLRATMPDDTSNDTDEQREK